MKRSVLLVGIGAALVGLALLVLLLPSPEERALEELREGCDIPYRLTAPTGELGELPGAIRIEGFGCYGLENEDLSLTLSGWPDAQDPYCLTGFTLHSPRYALFGLRVGDTLKEAERALEAVGYRPLKEDGTDWEFPLRYAKGPLTVVLGLGEDLTHLDSLSVAVEVSNREGVAF